MQRAHTRWVSLDRAKRQSGPEAGPLYWQSSHTRGAPRDRAIHPGAVPLHVRRANEASVQTALFNATFVKQLLLVDGILMSSSIGCPAIREFYFPENIRRKYVKNKEIALRPFQKYLICLDKTTGSRLKLAKQKLVDPYNIPTHIYTYRYIPRRWV